MRAERHRMGCSSDRFARSEPAALSCCVAGTKEVALGIEFSVNGKAVTLDVPAETPSLWALRDTAGLTGTKFGCGMGLCGACTVHLDGRPVRSCVTPVAEVQGRAITTIEGLDADARGRAVQTAWREL